MELIKTLKVIKNVLYISINENREYIHNDTQSICTFICDHTCPVRNSSDSHIRSVIVEQ